MKRAAALITTLLLLLPINLAVVQAETTTAPIYLNSTSGFSDPTVGIWDPATRTGTLIKDVNQTIQIDSDNVTLDGNGHSITASWGSNGIYINLRSGVTIKNVIIAGFSNGIKMWGSSGNTLINNTISNTGTAIQLYSANGNILISNNLDSNNVWGVYLLSSHANAITGNTITRIRTGQNNTEAGIYLESSSNNNISNNTMSQNALHGIMLRGSSRGNTLTNNSIDSNGGAGVFLLSGGNTFKGNTMTCNRWNFEADGNSDSSFDNDIDTSNLVDGKPIYYLRNVSGQTIDSSTNAGVIYLINSNNITVRDLTLTKNWIGLYLWKTNNSQIENATFLNNHCGVWLRNSTGNTFANNTFSNNGTGIYTLYSDSNAIVGNQALYNTTAILLGNSHYLNIAGNTIVGHGYGAGIDIARSNNNTIQGNSISDSGDGLYLSYSSANNSITGNSIDSSEVGIYVYMSGSNNMLTGNTLSGNQLGIHMNLSSGNQIFNNRLMNNSTQAQVLSSGGNIFNQPAPVGGNYWSDWTSPDNDNDGFVDLPYVFTGGQDYLPIAGDIGGQDNVAPTTKLSLDGLLGNNGWYVSDVQVVLTAEDNEGGSGVSKTEYSFDGITWNTYASPFFVDEGATTVYYRSTDTAGNTEEAKTETVSSDKTPPSITGAATTSPNTYDWFKSDMTVHFTAYDNMSGLDTMTPDVTLSAEGAGQSASGIATDKAGNTASTTVSGINIDKTNAGSSILLTGLLGNNGWYVSDVQVVLTAEDNEGGSGVSKTEYSFDGITWNTYASPFFVDEGATTVYYRSTDTAGNTEEAKTETVSSDKTPPSITISSPGNGSVYLLGENVIADWQASDSLSGVSTVVGTTASGQAINTNSVGTKSFSVESMDIAGNMAYRASIYEVNYGFSGVLPPINLDGRSVFKLGSTIPVKFRLTDSLGNVCPAAVAQIYLAKVSNNTLDEEVEAVSTSTATIGNFFRYDSVGNQYIFNLSTKLLSAGTWSIRIALDDGSSKYAIIGLR